MISCCECAAPDWLVLCTRAQVKFKFPWQTHAHLSRPRASVALPPIRPWALVPWAQGCNQELFLQDSEWNLFQVRQPAPAVSQARGLPLAVHWHSHWQGLCMPVPRMALPHSGSTPAPRAWGPPWSVVVPGESSGAVVQLELQPAEPGGRGGARGPGALPGWQGAASDVHTTISTVDNFLGPHFPKMASPCATLCVTSTGLPNANAPRQAWP